MADNMLQCLLCLYFSKAEITPDSYTITISNDTTKLSYRIGVNEIYIVRGKFHWIHRPTRLLLSQTKCLTKMVVNVTIFS